MSADAHRAEAERERTLAAQHEARYNPRARAPDPTPDPAMAEPRPGGPGVHLPNQNPTEVELYRADQHRAHAQAHKRAAAELERFESAECHAVPASERAACPLLGPVQALEDRPGGVRVHLARPESGPQVLASMRCHLAFARTRGFSEPTGCPLYMRGLRIEPGPGEGQVDLFMEDERQGPELRRRVREEFSPQQEPRVQR